MNKLSFEERARRFVTLEEDIVFLEHGSGDEESEAKLESSKDNKEEIKDK